MNRSAQKQVLIILLILLSLCLGGLVYWYFFNYKCGVLPNEFEFLEKFNTRNECRQKEYEIKGVIYNIREKEGDVIFDLNIWDKDTRESSYCENLKLPRNSFKGNFELTEGNWNAVKAKLILYGSGRKEIEIDELKMTGEEYSEVFNTVYEAITEGPLLIDEKYLHVPYPDDGSNAVFTEVRHRDLFPEQVEEITEAGELYIPEVYDGPTNKILYRPWILSYLYTKQGELGIEISKDSVIDILSFDYEQYRKSLIENLQKGTEECIDCSIEPPEDSTGEPINQSNYVESRTFTCLMLYQIQQNLELGDNSLIRGYCDYEYFEHSIDEYIDKNKLTKDYTLEEYLGIIDSQIISENIEDRYSPLHSSNVSSILIDEYASRKLNNITIDSSWEELVNYVLDYILDYGAPYLKNVCAISYFSNELLGEKIPVELSDINSISQKTMGMFANIDKRMIELMEDDIYASLICLEGYDGIEIENQIDEITRVQLLKILNLYMYENDEILGIWKDKEYDVRINARFLKLFVSNRNILL